MGERYNPFSFANNHNPGISLFGNNSINIRCSGLFINNNTNTSRSGNAGGLFRNNNTNSSCCLFANNNNDNNSISIFGKKNKTTEDFLEIIITIPMNKNIICKNLLANNNHVKEEVHF